MHPVVGVMDVKHSFSLNMWKLAPLLAMMEYFIMWQDFRDSVGEDLTNHK